MNARRKRILIAIDWYLPGYRGGGPITSIANLVAALSDRYEFLILTSDRDYGQKVPHPAIVTDAWVSLAPHCQVWYCSPDASSYRHFRRIIAETEYDLLYLNSMFSLRYTIFPLWNSRSAKAHLPVLLAPRGMLHAGALALKPLKKKLFLGLLRLTGIHKQLTFQATDDQEVLDIQAVFGKDSRVLQAGNLPKMEQPPFVELEKRAGVLRLVFLSRLTEKKGLHHLIGYLATQPAQVRLDIIGPDEEPGYWARCAALIAQLPGNIVVEKHAPMPPGEAMAWLQAAHAFAMPTHGENFGHAIFEAFCAGRPVLISDQTPWQGLAARHLGWDIPLKDEAAYGEALTALSGMDQAEWNVWARASWDFAAATIAETGLVDAQVAMVEAVLASAAEADLLAQGERDL